MTTINVTGHKVTLENASTRDVYLLQQGDTKAIVYSANVGRFAVDEVVLEGSDDYDHLLNELQREFYPIPHPNGIDIEYRRKVMDMHNVTLLFDLAARCDQMESEEFESMKPYVEDIARLEHWTPYWKVG